MRRSSSWIAVLPSLVIPVCFGLMMYLGLSYSINQGHITNDTVLRYLTGHPVSKVTVGMFFVGVASLLLIASNVFEQFSGEKRITLTLDQDAQNDPPEEASQSANADHSQDSSNEDSANEDSASVRAAGRLAVRITKTAKIPKTAKSGGVAKSKSKRPDSAATSDKAVRLGKRLSHLPGWLHNHYLWQRLQSGLHFAYRTDSTEGLEDELKYLADLDLDHQQRRYSLVQILIWATPMLGFLGTVLGISQALGGIDVGPDNNLQTMMDGLRGNLYIAFDTTALALTLSMLMMFGQFLVDRFETQLLLLVDQRAQGELNRHLSIQGSGPSGTYKEMAQNIVEANRESAEQQTKIWKKTIHSAEQAWSSTLTDTNLQVQASMSEALDENVSNLAHYLGEAIDKADNAMAHRWQQWQVTLSDSARQLAAQQNQISEQTVLLRDLLAEKQRDSEQSATTEANTQPQFQLKPQTQLQSQPQPEVVAAGLPATERAASIENLVEQVVEQVVEEVVEKPQSPQESEAESPQASIINFQSYLNDVLARARKGGEDPDSQSRQRGTQDEVILPFNSASSRNASDSDGSRFRDAA